MKIEMGESLGMSWMKHAKGCSTVQLNWKTSPQTKWMHLDDLEQMLEELKCKFGEDGIDIFGKDSVSQIVRQTECDVLGVSLKPDCPVTVYAMEVAIHLKGVGLHYSGTKHGDHKKKVNVSDDKVTAKLCGIAMALYSSMGLTKGEISFASPIVDDKLLSIINARLDTLESVLNSHGLNFKFKMYANRDFYREILQPVLAVADTVSDTNELFLRAMQLYMASARRWGQESDIDPTPPPQPVDPPIAPGPVPSSHHKRTTWDVFVGGEPYQMDLPMGEAAYYTVERYAALRPGIDFPALHDAFPREANGVREVVVVDNPNLDQRRFCRTTVRLDDATLVLITNQWCGQGPNENWQRFVNWVEGLDDDGLPKIRIVPHKQNEV